MVTLVVLQVLKCSPKVIDPIDCHDIGICEKWLRVQFVFFLYCYPYFGQIEIAAYMGMAMRMSVNIVTIPT